MTIQYFHLTIGPVQAFVVQARRTRDFWAGSFILSFLSSVAMAAVKQQGGKIEFPLPDDNYLDWLAGTNNEPGTEPLQGSVPNRFKALGAQVGADFDAAAVVSAVQTAWQELAQRVWQYDIEPVVGADSLQQQIWQRQICQFWDISWCLTEQNQVSNLLDRRKNWRNHLIDDEPGVKCSLMEGYQELSGEERPGEGVRIFWNRVRAQSQNLARDLREDEHLCAIALVKRRFVHYFAELNITLPTVSQFPPISICGWKIPASVPSVAYLAASPWLAATINASHDNAELLTAIKELQHALQALDVPWEGKVLRNIKNAIDSVGLQNWRWQQVNGQYLFAPALQQMLKEANKCDSLLNTDCDYLKTAETKLKAIRTIAKLGEPSPFYAVLLMDGDSLGAQMSQLEKQQGISAGLNAFTQGVPAIVEEYSGFLVYAGGDDVLALLPQPYAIACGDAIRQLYDRCFAAVNTSQGEHLIVTSLSGAIEFAHYKTPLTRILQDAHDLLDKVAKEETGRNSLAIRVWKPGGLHAQWSAPWSVVGQLAVTAQQIAEHLQGDLSRSFFFKLEDIISALGLACDHVEHGFDEDIVRSLVRAAWVHTGNKLDKLPEQMDMHLLNACRTVRRVVNGESFIEVTSSRFAPGVIRLLHFLATENQRFVARNIPATNGDAA